MYGTYSAISHDKRFVPLQWHFPKYVRSALIGWFL
jgi:hypothetical protein